MNQPVNAKPEVKPVPKSNFGLPGNSTYVNFGAPQIPSAEAAKPPPVQEKPAEKKPVHTVPDKNHGLPSGTTFVNFGSSQPTSSVFAPPQNNIVDKNDSKNVSAIPSNDS